MSANRAINIESCEPGKPVGFVKLWARGKIGLLFSSDNHHAKAAEECFRRALKISVELDAHSFAIEMHRRGVSEKAINEFLDSCTLVDEVHLSPVLN